MASFEESQSFARNKHKIYLCFQDYSCPPTFQDIDYQKLSGPENDEIKESFKDLSKQMNEVMKEEYEMKDRKKWNMKGNFINPLVKIMIFIDILIVKCS